MSEGKKTANPNNRSRLKRPKEIETPFIPQLCGNNCKHPVYPIDATMRTIDAEANFPFPIMMTSPTLTFLYH